MEFGEMAARLRTQGVLSEGGRYLLASAAALVADLSAFSVLAWLGWGWHTAATGGFLVGSLVAYAISIGWVFSVRSVRSRSVEWSAFVLIGCFGLLVVQGVMWLCIEELGMAGGIARLVAVGFSFTFNFFMRKMILFRSCHRVRSIGDGEGEAV